MEDVSENLNTQTVSFKETSINASFLQPVDNVLDKSKGVIMGRMN